MFNTWSPWLLLCTFHITELLKSGNCILYEHKMCHWHHHSVVVVVVVGGVNDVLIIIIHLSHVLLSLSLLLSVYDVWVGQSSLSSIWSQFASHATTSSLLSSRNVWRRRTISRWRNDFSRCGEVIVGRSCIRSSVSEWSTCDMLSATVMTTYCHRVTVSSLFVVCLSCCFVLIFVTLQVPYSSSSSGSGGCWQLPNMMLTTAMYCHCSDLTTVSDFTRIWVVCSMH